MLAALTIHNLAVVDSVDLEFKDGMTALTGETGAGKSILVDAIGLVLGDRADNGMIRAGCDRAEITATFDISTLPETRAWLEDRSIQHEGECLIRRVLVRDGRSRAFVNGTPCSINDLSTLANGILDIHGQHAHQSLTRRGHQRELLDAYGGHQALAEEVATAADEITALNRRINDLQSAEAERAGRLDLLRFQVSELEELNLQADEWENLETEYTRLTNATDLKEQTETLLVLLYGDNSAQVQLDRAADILTGLEAMDPNLRDSLEMAQNALIQVNEIKPALRAYAEQVEMDPARLRELDERIGQLHATARKYRVAPATLPDRLAELQDELSGLEGTDKTVEHLTAEKDSLRSGYDKLAARLRKARRKTAKRLAEEVTQSMKTLNMPGGHFDVKLMPAESDEVSPHGTEGIEFHVTANPGQPAQPLAQVASGGELSRISLAIQVAAAECSQTPTLIFDEVDVGIGGGVAEIVGRLLQRVGRSRQVLCVTHLPQVAAQANHHLRVEKEEKRSSTSTHILTLDEDARIAELARMLGGVKITKQTMAHAREMLSLAAAS